MNAARDSLVEEIALLFHEFFYENFLPLNKLVRGEALGCIKNERLAMEGVATVHVEILTFVRGFSVEVCTNLAILEVDHCVQKCDLFS